MQHQGNSEKLESSYSHPDRNNNPGPNNLHSWNESSCGEDIGEDVVDRRNRPIEFEHSNCVERTEKFVQCLSLVGSVMGQVIPRSRYRVVMSFPTCRSGWKLGSPPTDCENLKV